MVVSKFETKTDKGISNSLFCLPGYTIVEVSLADLRRIDIPAFKIAKGGSRKQRKKFFKFIQL